ncbi:MAG: hypothetical protein IPO01_13150 [Chitinophagaceae bacterium]|nr:hypothetical protein [Chitinophagaceae bacterium]MBK7307416.1 hypothetical protein [Chitinophagaceae bacterium]MBK9486105.1 hypothetical protein [Chitinophagaceae bacterium]
MQHNTAIFESLFNRNFSDTGTADFLKEITDRHPYFSPAHFFLLQNVKDDSAAFEKQAVRTNLFFNNPHWLNFQIRQTGMAAIAEMPIIDLPETIIPQTEIVVVDDLPDNTDAPDPDTHQPEKEIEPMHIELKMPEQKSNLAAEAMLFEPMHMVDYFASQGIKLTEEVQTADKLGKQLKSFTEWLKTMKKVHVENEAENPVKTDTTVQLLAENSNTETEVLTESMAEVFARQGKMAKASEVYQKLSLLNPAKSTYFAAKLENLKGL